MLVTFDTIRSKYCTITTDGLSVLAYGYNSSKAESVVYLTRGNIPKGRYYFEINVTLSYYQNPRLSTFCSKNNVITKTNIYEFPSVGLYRIFIDNIDSSIKIILPSGATVNKVIPDNDTFEVALTHHTVQVLTNKDIQQKEFLLNLLHTRLKKAIMN